MDSEKTYELDPELIKKYLSDNKILDQSKIDEVIS
jgi:hypothetical protein